MSNVNADDGRLTLHAASECGGKCEREKSEAEFTEHGNCGPLYVHRGGACRGTTWRSSSDGGHSSLQIDFQHSTGWPAGPVRDRSETPICSRNEGLQSEIHG